MSQPFEPEEIDWNRPKLKQYSESSECGEKFRAAYECWYYSTSQIRGIDCANPLNEYIECCQENSNACDPAILESIQNENE